MTGTTGAGCCRWRSSSPRSRSSCSTSPARSRCDRRGRRAGRRGRLHARRDDRRPGRGGPVGRGAAARPAGPVHGRDPARVGVPRVRSAPLLFTAPARPGGALRLWGGASCCACSGRCTGAGAGARMPLARGPVTNVAEGAGDRGGRPGARRGARRPRERRRSARPSRRRSATTPTDGTAAGWRARRRGPRLTIALVTIQRAIRSQHARRSAHRRRRLSRTQRGDPGGGPQGRRRSTASSSSATATAGRARSRG